MSDPADEATTSADLVPTSGGTASKWCPSCGDEYEQHVTACADCKVPLVDERPTELEPVTKKDDVPYAQRAQAFDLQHFDEFELAALKQRLMNDPIEHQWASETMVVAYPGYVEFMERYIREVRTGHEGDDGVDVAGDIVGLGRRGIANAIDTAIGPGLGALGALVLDLPWVAAAALVVFIANNVRGAGHPGRTLGRAAVGTDLLARSGEALTVGEGVTRWVAKDGPVIVLLVLLAAGITDGAATIAGYAAIGWWIVVGSSIVMDRNHRSVADLFADTVVYELPLDDPDDVLEPELVDDPDLPQSASTEAAEAMAESDEDDAGTARPSTNTSTSKDTTVDFFDLDD